MPPRVKKSKPTKPSSGKTPADRLASSGSFPIVGIGASAGGLEAFASLLGALPSDTNTAFVLVQHLAPKHESLLSEILARSSSMPVTEAKQGMQVEPNHVYVIPPNSDLTIDRNVLHLKSRTFTRGQHMPVDVFLRSLAEDRKHKAIGVILSGTGSDGVLGLKAIKAEGGITFAQSENTAKYPGMSHSAVAAGVVDFVLSTEGIAREIARVGRHPYLTSLKAVFSDEVLPDSRGNLTKILVMLRKAFDTDFADYKDTTIRRRIKRRMVLHKIDHLEAYVHYLRDHPVELEALYHDILIIVTSFLRDPKTFEALKNKVFPAITENRTPDAPIRVWVPGCATGEEAFSIAICLLEYLREKGLALPIQIFGTDLSQPAIDRARAGMYLENIALDVSPERLRRFFVKVEGGYAVSRVVRDLCVFAQHDLIQDPPFSRMDLISCRNLLIYLGQVQQGKVLMMFHYALKSHSHLMLGSSESVGSFAPYFRLLDKSNRIYIRKEMTARPALEFPRVLEARRARAVAEARAGGTWKPEFDVLKEADRIVQANYAPAGVVVNEDMVVLQFRGHTSCFLEPAPGAASFNLMKMAREGLLPVLHAAILQARKEGGPVRKEDVRFRVDGVTKTASVAVHPLRGPHRAEKFFLILFDEQNAPKTRGPRQAASKAAKAKNRERQEEIGELQREIAGTKEYLESIVQEQEATNEELKSANEEILSSNEELQSTNEELETAKEELQSGNEELTTVNEELQNRNSELIQANNDMSNLFSSIHIPVVMLGANLQIRRFNSPAEKKLNLIPSDIGRPLTDINLGIVLPELGGLILQAIERVTTKDLEIQDTTGCWQSLSVRPYKTQDNRVDGVVLTLIDIDALKRQEAQLLRFKFISDHSNDAADLVDEKGRLLYVNRRAWARLGYTEAEMLQMNLADIDPLHPKEEIVKLFQRLQRERIPPFESLRRRKDGTTFPVEVSVTGIEFEGKPHMFIMARNITERKRAEEDLRNAHDGLEQRVKERTSELNQALISLQAEVAERRSAQEALKASEHRYRDLFEKANDAIFTLDREGNFTSINARAEEVFGLTRQEVLGRNLHAIATEEQVVELLQIFARTPDDESAQYEITFRAKDGHAVPLEIRSRLIYENGEPTGIQCIARDVTERQRMEEERREISVLMGEAQNEERRHLARELHDTTGQNLVALKLNLGMVYDKATKLDPKLGETLSEIQNLADQCIREIRTLSYQLHPPLLEERGLASALRLYSEGFSERSGIAVQVDISEELGRVPKEVELTSFRIAQECLSNVHRHSGCSKARIRIERADSHLTLEVSSTGGHGFDDPTLAGVHQAEEKGIGIRGMRERLRQIGGTLEIESTPTGSAVRAILPLKPDGS